MGGLNYACSDAQTLFTGQREKEREREKEIEREREREREIDRKRQKEREREMQNMVIKSMLLTMAALQIKNLNVFLTV